MSQEQIKRITQAIIETQNLLNKELSYSEKHQNKQMINFYVNHIKKLTDMAKSKGA